MNDVELKASELLLDVGVSIPIRPLRYLNMKKKPWRITIKTPCAGNLIRIGRIYLKSKIVYDETKVYTTEENMQLMVDHGKAISLMVAYCIVRGWFAGAVFGKLVACWLRWRVHPLMLQEAWFQMMGLLDVSPFRNITRSVKRMNLMKPRLGQ